jgi:hypothetical protein
MTSDGAITQLNDPDQGGGYLGTQAMSIDAAGRLAGYYYDSKSVPHGFLYSK